MTLESLLLYGLTSLLVGALLTVFLKDTERSRSVSRFVALVAVIAFSVAASVVSLSVLLSTAERVGPMTLWRFPLVNAALSIRVDALSAFFLLIIGVLSPVVVWYSIAYTRKMRGLRWFYPPLLLFIFGMAGVVVVDDFFFFFVPWEFMTLNSYLLVIFHREKKESLDAGFKYFLIAHAGTVALFFGVVWLARNGGGSFAFDDIAASMPQLFRTSPGLTHVALGLILLGFLVKSGAFPFGMWWLPDAHPAAPSPVSALLSGVMIKLGLYGTLRVFFDILPVGSWSVSWGVLIASLGVLSLFFGTMRALVQHDSKRLLAYHSIGQIGYVLLGFGIGLALMQSHPFLATIAFVGGAFHLLNHACFKALLFLNAGTFELATGERDLNRLGGLGGLLPLTAVCTVVASFSIAGLPPFNGFASKWLLYHGSIWATGGLGILFLSFGVVAVFISAVTLASFLKFLGATIWGTPSPLVLGTKRIGEGAWLAGSQGFLALVCLGLGLLPQLAVRLCYSALGSASNSLAESSAVFGSSSFRLALHDGPRLLGVWYPIAVGGLLVAAIGVGELIRGAAAPRHRSVPVWKCASEVAAEETRFRADNYYVPFKRFVHLVAPEIRIAWRPHAWPIIPKVLNPDAWAFRPLVNSLLRAFRWLAASRAGLPQVYPAWNLIGLALSLLVLFLIWWGGSRNG
jgi:hydrogenase-4 component B